MLALALLLLIDVAPIATPKRVVAYIGDERACGGFDLGHDVSKRSGDGVSRTYAWSDAAKLRGDEAPAVVVVAVGPAQLALARGPFMKSAHALLDSVRTAWPDAWVVLAAPDAAEARGWLNAIAHKRGDGRLSTVLVPPHAETREQCAARADLIVAEARARLR